MWFSGIVSFGILVLSAYGAPNPHIIEGEISAKGRWPWMLSLERIRDSGEYSHTCGAALLTPKWILTAAHCLTASTDPRHFRVLVGAFNITAEDYEDMVYLQTIVLHEDYDPTNPPGVPNDVAVAELETEVDLSHKDVGLVQLPRRGDDFVHNPNCVATGWGRYDPDLPEASPVLRELKSHVWSRSECQVIWDEFEPGMGEDIFEEHVCIAGPEDGVCHGDSGSPLNCDVTGEGDWVVAGVASWASGQRCIGATGVYAGIEYFVDWVYSKVPGLPGNKP